MGGEARRGMKKDAGMGGRHIDIVEGGNAGGIGRLRAEA